MLNRKTSPERARPWAICAGDVERERSSETTQNRQTGTLSLYMTLKLPRITRYPCASATWVSSSSYGAASGQKLRETSKMERPGSLSSIRWTTDIDSMQSTESSRAAA